MPTLSATLLGELFGFSTGFGAPAVAPMSRESFIVARKMTALVFSLGPVTTVSFLSEFQALYLPAFLRTFYSNTLGDFNAIHPNLFAYYLGIYYRTAASPYVTLFLREHLEEGGDFYTMMEETHKTLSSVRAEVAETWRMDNFRQKLNFDLACKFGGISDTIATTQLYHIASTLPPEKLSRSRRASRSRRDAAEKQMMHDAVWESIREDYGSLVDNLEPYEIREARRRAGMGERSALGKCAVNEGGKVWCEKSKLGCCSWCQVVLYCSEAHRELHWKDHEPFCFAPTW